MAAKISLRRTAKHTDLANYRLIAFRLQSRYVEGRSQASVDSPQQFFALVLAQDPGVATTLAASGFAVVRALTGSEAIRLFDRKQFDLVLLEMDLLRPKSLNACRRIRELAPNVKIIMIADEDVEEDRIRALEAGADDCVNRPLQLRELAARARAVLRLCSPRPARGRGRPSDVDVGQESPPGAASGGENISSRLQAAKEPPKF